MEDGDAPIPNALREGFRFERFGSPYNGGYRQWPYKWLMPVEMALSTYHALKAVNQANRAYKGDPKGLAQWKSENERLVKYVLDVERLVAEQSESDNG